MPILTLKFKLPEEQEEYEVARKGLLYFSVINDFYNYLRPKIKHGEYSEELTEVWDELHRLCAARGVDPIDG